VFVVQEVEEGGGVVIVLLGDLFFPKPNGQRERRARRPSRPTTSIFISFPLFDKAIFCLHKIKRYRYTKVTE
jgi:hypothetical protein